MHKQVENWYPFAGGVAGGAVFLYCQHHFCWHYPSTMPSLFSAVIGVSAIAVGFLGTTQSILMGIGGWEIMSRLREGGYFDRIMDYLLAAIHWSFGLAAISAMGIIVDPSHENRWYLPATGVWVWLLISSGLSYYRIISLFSEILRHGNQSPISEPPTPKAIIEDE